MIIRSAILEGTVDAADRPAFDHHMAHTVRDAIRQYPGLRDVRLRWPVEVEPDTPAVYVIFDLYFDDVAAMHAALASPTRQAVRTTIAAAMGAFKGRVYHLVTEER